LRKILYIGIFIFLFFPYVGIIKSIDIQPFYVIVSTIALIFIHATRRKIKFNLLIVSLILYLPILTRILIDPDLDLTFFITYLFAFLTAITTYSIAFNAYNFLSLRILFTFTLIYLLVGLIQVYFDRTFLNILISRTSNVDYIENLIVSGRGVVSLTAEPSQFGKTIIVLNFIYIIAILRDLSPNSFDKILYSLVFFIFFNFFLSGSAYMLFFHVLFLALFLLMFKRKVLIFLITVVFLFQSFVVFGGQEISSNLRLLDIVNNIDNIPYLFSQGAFGRLMNVPISIKGFFVSSFYGLGNTSREYFGSFYILNESFDFAFTSRNLGGFIEFLLRFGLFSVLFYLFYFFILIKIYFTQVTINNSKILVGPFLFFFLFFITIQDGSPLNPLAWFSLFFTYKFSLNNKSNNLYSSF